MNAVTALRYVWERDVVPTVTPNHCILAARVGSEVLRYFGHGAAAVPTEALVGNALAADLSAQGVPPADWPENAWSVGTQREAEGPGYSGHVVLVVDCVDLLDLSFGQFSRPSRDLACPATLACPGAGAKLLRGEGIEVTSEDGAVVVEFIPFEDRGYEAVPDWKIGRRHLAGPTIRAVRELLSDPSATVML